jgi:hypothetical protein
VNVFLDECIDRRFAKTLSEHNVKTAQQMGWTGVKNGTLLALVAAQFDAFVTVDRNLSYQQNLTHVAVAVLVLRAKSNRLADLSPLTAKLLSTLAVAAKGTATIIE